MQTHNHKHTHTIRDGRAGIDGGLQPQLVGVSSCPSPNVQQKQQQTSGCSQQGKPLRTRRRSDASNRRKKKRGTQRERYGRESDGLKGTAFTSVHVHNPRHQCPDATASKKCWAFST